MRHRRGVYASGERGTTIDQICLRLREKNWTAVKRVVRAIGAEQALALLEQALKLEANGGILTHDGQRRRTPGGVFFQLARAVVPKNLYRQVFPKEAAATAPTVPVQRVPVAPPMTWAEAKALIVKVMKTPGEAKTVKLTLIGRPLKVIAQKDCVVISLKGKDPPSLPKGLPAIPEGSAITWAVFITNKQWHKVKVSIEANADDQLIIEGYPLVGKNGVAAVMTTNCKSVLIEQT
jgi:hypothetical protein